MKKKLTPTQQKDNALWKGTWALGAAYLFISAYAKRVRCRCGSPPNVDGIPCNACMAVELKETLIKATKELEDAYNCNKKKSKRFMGK